MIQSIVDSHAERLGRRVSDFTEQLETVVAEAKRSLSSHLRRTLVVEDGLVYPLSNNASTMRDLDRTYREALSLAGYHAALGAYVEGFSSQIDEFREMYSLMRSKTTALPELSFDLDAGDVLATRASMSLAALESSTVEVSASLRQSAVLVWGDLPQDFLLTHVGEVVDRTAKIGQLAKELATTFFRNVSTLAYENLEASGLRPMYRYVGLVNDRNRPFCRGLFSSSPMLKEQISRLDNGQLPDAFHNAGGRGCSHFWWVDGVA